ncbi:RING-H2 finger protein ATL74-like [Zingiber officinale]|uniref:RING-H2 finger protein ATL74-like n=1 Tax=Zingiber officinale TaxID=94328 RepID=UPI001C4D0E75|nr:RING-H2 finger protein ATL74-like [Zingiber officinale]
MDGNMIIILAALLCALIIALGLNSVVRCAVQWGRRLAFEMPEESATRSAATSGLKKQALRRLPVAVYGPGAGVLATECPICLAEFADGEEVRVLPWCHHGFHVGCIDEWLSSHSSCPTCRQSLLEDGSGPPAANTASQLNTAYRSNLLIRAKLVHFRWRAIAHFCL